MNLRDRIIDFRRVPASELRPHPSNWRTHPPAQRNALQGALAEIGIADAVLARKLPDGSLQLIDGHLRTEIAGDTPLPVLVLDLDESEAAQLLATLDPLAAMAGTDADKLADVLGQFETRNADLQALLDGLGGGLIDIPDGNKDIDEEAMSDTQHECPKCGFQW